MHPALRVVITFVVAVALIGGLYFATASITKYTGYSITGKIIELITGKKETLVVDSGNMEDFANCLGSKSKLYVGGDTSSNQQKAMFGENLKFINVVNCGANRALCSERGIKFPSWEIKNRIYPGRKTLKELSEISGCKLE